MMTRSARSEGRAAGTQHAGDGAVAARPDVHEIVAARLQADGQRYTASRRRLVDILVQAGRPLSVPEVLEADQGLPVSSAYRNLVVLEQAGAVGRMLASEGARYELAEGLLAHHHHLVCLSCGLVADVTLTAHAERAIDAATDEAAGATGFRATGHRLDIAGTCAQCAAP
jgi:Fur family ferric uptake transcriptional regulator